MSDALAVLYVLIGVVLGMGISYSCQMYDAGAELNSVGIERIVRCNNSHSNWYEIVWKETK